MSEPGNRFIICQRPEFPRIQRCTSPWSRWIRNISAHQWENRQIPILFAFLSEHSNLFYLKAEFMSAQQFGKSSGYEKWHRRLGHTSNKDIQETIKHVIGLEELLQTTYEKHTKCASCMIGKSTLEDYPGEKIRADGPLKQVNIDSFSSPVVSIKGYFHAVVIVDCHTGYWWLYGMKTKDEMLQVV